MQSHVPLSTSISLPVLYSEIKKRCSFPKPQDSHEIRQRSHRKMGSNCLSAAVIFESLGNYRRSECLQFVSILSSRDEEAT